MMKKLMTGLLAAMIKANDLIHAVFIDMELVGGVVGGGAQHQLAVGPPGWRPWT